ncbi:hypothetical protein SKAU_G00188930 [Synaphobranchus kaupii]|uniref:Uncharacterized protein n=1 Tax=Synaphobranchus kaupii TaxID=118154 RepID=A0A9Q1FDA0_SYNKA|nr:hypothetical protein SKAU_G00188930 [Synaphobranchus kaupii]
MPPKSPGPARPAVGKSRLWLSIAAWRWICDAGRSGGAGPRVRMAIDSDQQGRSVGVGDARQNEAEWQVGFSPRLFVVFAEGSRRRGPGQTRLSVHPLRNDLALGDWHLSSCTSTG